MVENKTSKKKTSGGIILVAILLIILAAGGIYLYAGWVGYREAPKLIIGNNSRETYNSTYELSSEQETHLSAYGDPEAFTILFYEEETPDQGIQTVRLETWEYYTLGLGRTYINGELVSEDSLEFDNIGQLSPLPYSPAQFTAFMSLDEIIAAASIDSYIEVPLTNEIIEKGNLYYTDSLSFGLQDNQLVYVEALALIEN